MASFCAVAAVAVWLLLNTHTGLAKSQRLTMSAAASPSPPDSSLDEATEEGFILVRGWYIAPSVVTYWIARDCEGGVVFAWPSVCYCCVCNIWRHFCSRRLVFVCPSSFLYSAGTTGSRAKRTTIPPLPLWRAESSKFVDLAPLPNM